MYKFTTPTNILRLPDGAIIPADTGNRDYVEYLTWLALGNIPLPADIPVPTMPQSVTMRQARLALLNAGMLTTVNSAIASMLGTPGEAARIIWEFSNEVQRSDPLVSSLSGILNLTPEQLDQLFITANTL